MKNRKFTFTAGHAMAFYHLGTCLVHTENKAVHHRDIHVQETDGKLESGASKTSLRIDGVDPRV